MLHLYLLVSLFSVFTMEPVNFFDIQHQIDVEMEFSSNPLVHIGDPVLFKGAVVGSVNRINAISGSENQAARINIRLTSGSVPLDKKLVGLASSMKMSGVPGGPSSRSFVDIIHLSETSSKQGSSDASSNSGALKGFSSFHEFWSTKNL